MTDQDVMWAFDTALREVARLRTELRRRGIAVEYEEVAVGHHDGADEYAVADVRFFRHVRLTRRSEPAERIGDADGRCPRCARVPLEVTGDDDCRDGGWYWVTCPRCGWQRRLHDH